MMRVANPNVARDAFEEFDRMVNEVTRSKLLTLPNYDGLEPPIGDEWKQQAAQPRRLGGLGIANTTKHAPTAFLAAAAASNKHIPDDYWNPLDRRPTSSYMAGINAGYDKLRECGIEPEDVDLPRATEFRECRQTPLLQLGLQKRLRRRVDDHEHQVELDLASDVDKARLYTASQAPTRAPGSKRSQRYQN